MTDAVAAVESSKFDLDENTSMISSPSYRFCINDNHKNSQYLQIKSNIAFIWTRNMSFPYCKKTNKMRQAANSPFNNHRIHKVGAAEADEATTFGPLRSTKIPHTRPVRANVWTEAAENLLDVQDWKQKAEAASTVATLPVWLRHLRTWRTQKLINWVIRSVFTMYSLNLIRFWFQNTPNPLLICRLPTMRWCRPMPR